jgi:hypothetical protein
LEGQRQPSLGKLEEADFALWVGRLFRSRYAFVRSASVFIPGHVPSPLAAHTNTQSQNTGKGFLFPQWGLKYLGAAVWEVTPTPGDVLPHFWHLKPM